MLRIAQIKVHPVAKDLDGNADKLLDVLDELRLHRPDVVVTSEGFLDGYASIEDDVTRENIAQYAVDPKGSHHVDRIASWARANGSWFILGCARLVPTGVANSALILNRRGELVGAYDKTHLQEHDIKYEPGQALPVWKADFGVFGVMICADRRWPETVRTLALRGASIIFNPTYGMHREKNLHMMETRSYESEIFIAFTHPAQSLITDPTGGIVTNEEREEVRFAVTDVDLALVQKVREGISAHLRDRRPELYER